MPRLALRILAVVAALSLPPCRGLAFAPHGALGPVMVARGKEVPQDDAFAVNVVASACDCRMACWSDRRCVAASALAAEDNSTLCRLSKKGPFDSTLDDSPNATYIFWNENARVMDDGLVYTQTTRLGSYLEAEVVCNSVPGHRLPIFKTVAQRDVIDQLFSHDTSRAFWVDLRKTGGDYVWGDGTRFQDTEISALLNIARGALTEAAHSWYISSLLEKTLGSFKERTVCQANPFGVEW